KTSPFHGGIMGSIPVRVTIMLSHKRHFKAVYGILFCHFRNNPTAYLLETNDSLPWEKTQTVFYANYNEDSTVDHTKTGLSLYRILTVFSLK
ncbi:MAG: hypothetical protein J1F09_08735, partial [Oscillospiraceae bacterium]|nr:hypothetical protein [Oscillospiraceae bacterium]